MKAAFVRLSLVASLTAIAACGGSDEPGSARLSNLKEGMTLTQALDAMGKGADFNVVYSRDLPGDVKEPVLQAKETPIVFRNDTLLGWGWRYFVDEGMGKFQLPTPLRAVDTMTTPLVSDSAKKLDSAAAAATNGAPAKPDSTK
jgi:hypothetical protein